jgi:hypothetical protein
LILAGTTSAEGGAMSEARNFYIAVPACAGPDDIDMSKVIFREDFDDACCDAARLSRTPPYLMEVVCVEFRGGSLFMDELPRDDPDLFYLGEKYVMEESDE